MLQYVYPEFNWKPWKFHQVPKGYWNALTRQRHAVNELGKLLNITEYQQWFQVTSEQVAAMGFGSLLQLYSGSIQALVRSVLPELPLRKSGMRCLTVMREPSVQCQTG
jgi:hypothetical protein